ncbi:MAG: hypothetical protein HYZ81_10775 [Nitrospinae bacterium]|nr:hypothetical protein [Nitrospinota bacterium]
MTILRAQGFGWWIRTSILAVFLVYQTQAAGVYGEAVLLDKIMAVVNDEVLTLTDFEAHLALVKVFRPASAGVDREQAFPRFIEQTLLRQEALRTRIVEVGEAAVAQELSALEQRPGGPEQLALVLEARGLSLARVRAWLGHQLIVHAFIDRRVRLFVRVSDSEVTQYYQQHQQAIGEPWSDQIQEQIRRVLVEQRVNARVAQLVEELKRKANLQFPP